MNYTDVKQEGLNDEQKKRIKANVEQLDYLKGAGIIGGARQHLADEIYVFISSGGTGHKELFDLKKAIKNQVDPDDIKEKIMFLAVETDHKEIDKSVARGEFTKAEVLKVPYVGAHDSIKPGKILPQMEAWVHPDLWAFTGGNNETSKEFSGDGAAGRRQCGRVLLSQSSAQAELYGRLSRIPDMLARTPGIKKIKVFFLCGLAGGTGSGTIVDLSYLTRYFISELVTTKSIAVDYSAYLFMPSASSDEVQTPEQRRAGNRNAYAAMKEIDYYMTIAERNEFFRMYYGTSEVKEIKIGDNIFNFCTLVEGMGDGGIYFKNKAENARKIVADSILNIICADRANVIDGQHSFLVDSFLCNTTQQVNARIEAMSDNLWPRDVNYHYSVIGISSCVVPIDLLTVYVAKKIFDEVYRKFADASKADEEAAADFLDACGLKVSDLEKVWKTVNKKNFLKDLESQTNEEFRTYGPFYMVNLLKEAIKLIEEAPKEYLHLAQKKANGFGANENKWKRILQCYYAAADYFGRANNEWYEVYTYAVSVLKELIEDNAKLLTDAHEYNNQFGRTFCWSPIDLSKGDDASKAVEDYLAFIFNDNCVKKAAQAFVDRLCEKRDEWTDLTPEEGRSAKFDAAREIKAFIQSELAACINTKAEEFLVKVYSGKSDANVYESDPETGMDTYTEYTRTAAEQVFERLNREASALVSTKDFHLKDCYSNNYLTVPENCQYFYDALCDITAGTHGTTIFKTSAVDRIVLCRLYTGIPAWALEWCKGAEDIYEETTSVTEVGLHMDQGTSGTDWKRFPNLYPQKLWESDMNQRREREREIAEEIAQNMKKAYQLESLTVNPKQAEYYDVVLLKEEKSAEKLLEAANLDSKKAYSLKEVLDILVEKGTVERFKINFANQIMSTTDCLSDEELKKFRFELACRTIRRFHSKYTLLPETVQVLEKLQKLVTERAVVDESAITLFLNALKWDVITYNGVRSKWNLALHDETELRKLDTKFEKICAHYYGFQAFCGLDRDTKEEISGRLTELEEDASDQELMEADEKMENLKKSLSMLRSANKKGISPWSADSAFKSGNDSDWPMAKDDFVEKAGSKVEAKAIRDFYSDLISNI